MKNLRINAALQQPPTSKNIQKTVMDVKDIQSPPPSGVALGIPRKGMPQKVQFAILLIAGAAIVAFLVIGPAGLRALFSKEKTAESHVEAAPFQLSAAQWATIKTEPVKEIAFLPERQADGKIAIDADATTPVFPPYSGRVTALFVREGDYVEQGQPLFQIDSTDLVQAQNDLVAAVAAVAKSASLVNLLQTGEQRAHKLFDIQGGSLKDWQQAQADLAGAQNDQKAAQIALAAAKAKLRILNQSDETIAEIIATGHTNPDLTVPAPISGYVLQRKLGLRQYVSQGASDPVFAIGNLSSVWLVANVRESDAPFVKVGQPVEVRVTAFPDRVFKATINFVAASVDPNTHRLPIRAQVLNAGGLLKPEMWANFTIITGSSHKGLAVPEESIVYEGDTARVWVADKDHNTIVAHEIKTGVANGNEVEVLSGVSLGEQVITRGSIFIDRAASGN
jgi:membrane fusion protein, heavy metal efflux system